MRSGTTGWFRSGKRISRNQTPAGERLLLPDPPPSRTGRVLLEGGFQLEGEILESCREGRTRLGQPGSPAGRPGRGDGCWGEQRFALGTWALCLTAAKEHGSGLVPVGTAPRQEGTVGIPTLSPHTHSWDNPETGLFGNLNGRCSPWTTKRSPARCAPALAEPALPGAGPRVPRSHLVISSFRAAGSVG